MRFYRYEGVHAERAGAEEQSRAEVRERAYEIQEKSEDFSRSLREEACFFVQDATGDKITVGVICAEELPLEKRLAEYMKALGLETVNGRPEEIMFSSLLAMLRLADRKGYIQDDDEILETFGLIDLRVHHPDCEEYTEEMIELRSQAQVRADAEKHDLGEMLGPELDRIYAGKPVSRHLGHPVHYLLQTDDPMIRENSYTLLLQALYDRGRLQNRRHSYVALHPGNELSMHFYDCLYRSSFGGAVVVRFRASNEAESDYADGGNELIEWLCRKAKKYRNQVLTIFCLPRACEKVKETFYENLGSVSFVEFKEEELSDDRAAAFLKKLAKREGLRTDKKLLQKAEPEQMYSAAELRTMFETWRDEKLKTVIYPQYRQVQSVRREVVKTQPKGSAYDDLMEMIGLTEAKTTIKKALDYHKARKLFAAQGIRAAKPAMHMIFTGNPGTAKTTVARLFARIMKENGLLDDGRIVEVGRGDLVGKYVGWTAKEIQKKFRQAQGGVLFIDEAYSLVDDRSGSFGDEAINTIVQEMENHRDDTVVIFAGYPDKMEGFLNKNPGLRSRIAFHVKFENYDADELCEIAQLLAKQNSMKLTAEAVERLHDVFARASTETDFGNGRLVRNVLEQARMAQASRLLAGDVDSIGKTELSTICAEDIPLPKEPKRLQPRIGFC